MNTEDLITTVEQIESKRRQEWIASLEKRKVDEMEFHDRIWDPNIGEVLSTRSKAELLGNLKYYQTAAVSREYSRNWIRAHAKGRVVLDYACGPGHLTMLAAE